MCLGIPGRILEIRRDADPFACAVVDFGGVRKQAWLAYVPDAGIGDYVIVHVGFAIAMVDETEALRTLEVLRSMADAVAGELGGGTAVKYLDEYRDPALARLLLDEIRAAATRPWRIMEVCGGQTHTLVRQGIDELLPAGMRMIHGPGCPVCVTPLETIDKALAIAARPNVIFASFGDMLRVPGSRTSLLQLRAAGADVRVVYSPADAVTLATQNPDSQVVFFAVGFETTAPANAGAVLMAHASGLKNFSVLVSHVLVPPAMTAVLEAGHGEVQAFLAAGHVCAVMGWTEYEPLAAKYGTPIVVTGFEPLDLLEGILMAVRQLERGEAKVENQYARAVRRDGNTAAQEAIRRVFRVTDRTWRGIGPIPASGLELAEEFEAYDAELRFGTDAIRADEDPRCIAGLILTGRAVPTDCVAYGTACTPSNPLGAPMVSSEGTCAAFHTAGRTLSPAATTSDPGERSLA